MLPTYFLELADTNIAKDVYKKYFNDQYPETNSCVELDKQIASIQKDIDDIVGIFETDEDIKWLLYMEMFISTKKTYLFAT